MKYYEVFYLNSDGGPESQIVRAANKSHAAWQVARKTDPEATFSTVAFAEKEPGRELANHG